MEKALLALSMLGVTALAIGFEAQGSMYDPNTEHSINSIRGVEQDVQGLYYHYYYYYDDGQTVAAIIFLDILLPIACCIGIIITIVCVVRAVQRRKAREA